MPTPISALEHWPYDFVREVSPDAIDFYVDELSGIYLPDDFREANAEAYGVKTWRPEKRLNGKFGRFAIGNYEEGVKKEELGSVLVMGTTIGLRELDDIGHMRELRHYGLDDKMREIIREKELLGDGQGCERADYGFTRIKLGETGKAVEIEVSGSSGDFGRANTEGRQLTCEIFAELLRGTIIVTNTDPEPREHDQIVEG